MHQTAPAGAPAPANDLAALSAALISAHAWAKAHPGVLSEAYEAGYQRTIRWKVVQREGGPREHFIVLCRAYLAPYDLDHENIALALMGAKDRDGSELVVLERRWMDEANHNAGVCYRVGMPPPPPEPEPVA